MDQKSIKNRPKSWSGGLQSKQKWGTPSALGDQNRGTPSVLGDQNRGTPSAQVVLDLGTFLAASWGALGSVLEASWKALGRLLGGTGPRNVAKMAPTWLPKWIQDGQKIGPKIKLLFDASWNRFLGRF